MSKDKIIKSGESIGYNRTYQAEGDMKIAIVPIGYWHGYNRLFSNKGVVIVNGKRCPVVGVVSMSMITIDITQVKDVAVGTLVTLIGEDGSNSIYADELSEIIEGSYHELLTRLNPLIKRLYI